VGAPKPILRRGAVLFALMAALLILAAWVGSYRFTFAWWSVERSPATGPPPYTWFRTTTRVQGGGFEYSRFNETFPQVPRMEPWAAGEKAALLKRWSAYPSQRDRTRPLGTLGFHWKSRPGRRPESTIHSTELTFPL
jgi:hypothetical protein